MTPNSTESESVLNRNESVCPHKNGYTHVCGSSICGSQKMETAQTPISDEWVNKMWSIQTIEFYTAIKKTEAWTHPTTWTILENIVLGRKSQATHGISPLTQNV